LLEGYEEYYSAELAQKVKRGMRESCLKGNAAGVKPIFGYRLVKKICHRGKRGGNRPKAVFGLYGRKNK